MQIIEDRPFSGVRPEPINCSCGHFGQYARTQAGRTICDACSVRVDIGAMLKDGNSRRLPLYFDGVEVTNWPGTLRFRAVGIRPGHHNIARTRTDFWFQGPDGREWHGVVYGENTQVAHCRRTGKRWGEW